MPRAQFRDVVMMRGASGVLMVAPPGASVALYDIGTSNPIAEAIYAAEGGSQVLSNPLYPSVDGAIEFWLAEERELDLVASCPGLTTVRATITTDGIAGSGTGIAGPAGPQGPIGPQGPQGIQGVPGTSYPDGGVDLVIDGGGVQISTGTKLDLEVPYNLSLASMRLMADQSGSIVLDILRAPYASFPGSAASICGSSPPTLSGAQKTQDTTLSGWMVSLSKGDWLRINVTSVATIQRVTLSLGGPKF